MNPTTPIDPLATRDAVLAKMISQRADGVYTLPIEGHPNDARVASYVDALDFQRIEQSPAGIASALTQRLGYAIRNPKLREAGKSRLRDKLPVMLRDLYHYTHNGDRMADPYSAPLAWRAFTTMEAADLFGLAAEAAMVSAWDEEGESDFTGGWVGESETPSFKKFSRIIGEEPASMDRLDGRGAEAKDANFVFRKACEGQLIRFAQKAGLDEMDIINDQLNALTDIPEMFGRMCRRLRSDLVASILLRNQALDDTGLLFNATAITTAGGHANLGNIVLGSAGLAAAADLMRVQKATDTGRQLNLRPRYLIVPGKLENTARGLLNDLALPDDPPMALRVAPQLDNGVIDPRDDAEVAGSETTYFISSGPARGIELVFLEGRNKLPEIRSYVLAEGRWGIGWDLAFDMAGIVTGFQGLVKGNA